MEWPQIILEKFQNRNVPLFTAEDVAELNQSFKSKVEEINESRRRQKEILENEMTRCTNAMNDLNFQQLRDNGEIRELVAVSKAKMNIFEHGLKYDMLEAEMQAAVEYHRIKIQRIQTEETHLQQEYNDLKKSLLSIRFLSNQSIMADNQIIEKHWAQVGWIPSIEEYQLIQNNTPPPEQEIMRHISFHHDTKLSNMPLSIYNIMTFAEEIGATDDVLLSMIISYMKKHKQDIKLDTTKHVSCVIDELARQCSTEHEKKVVLQHLQSFSREKTESFARCILRFSCMHAFYMQLENPISADDIALRSDKIISTITQLLISTKCRDVFNKWATETIKRGEKPTENSIIRIISELEEHSELRLQNAKQLPGPLITTFLHTI